MNNFVILSGIIFAVVCVVHAARLVRGWKVQIGAAEIGPWASWLGMAASGALAVWAWRLAAM